MPIRQLQSDVNEVEDAELRRLECRCEPEPLPATSDHAVEWLNNAEAAPRTAIGMETLVTIGG